MAGGDGVVGSSNVAPINSSNIGFKLLQKHGWREGTGLGLCEQGRLEPIETYLKKDKCGVGAEELVDATAGFNSIRCEICKIDCNSRDVLEKHMNGKKHKRNVQLLMVSPAIFPTPLGTTPPNDYFGMLAPSSVSEELEMKKRKMLEGGAAAESMIFCSICNIACNSQAVYIAHLSGKKHAAQVLEFTNATGGNDLMVRINGSAPIAGAEENMEMGKGEVIDIHEARRMIMESRTAEADDIETKKRRIVESGALESDIRVCVICNVVCNGSAVFNKHLAGKKHAAQVETHNGSNGKRETPAVSGVANHIEVEAEDIETKKRKMLEGGGIESDIRVCSLCNVVCNSPAVFAFHLGGQKHATMLRNQEHSELK